MQVYEAIYDVVADNLHNAGMDFEYQKTTFLYDVTRHPQIIDISDYLDLPNRQFFQAVFVTVYKRLPEGKEVDAWENQWELPEEEFRKEFLRSTANSSVAAINHIQFVNNPYFEQKKGLKYKVLGMLYGLTDKSFLREFGKKLPAPVQKIIRKVFL